jgi:parallel beta-helix repeat protein
VFVSSEITVRRSSANGNHTGITVEGGSDATTLTANVANRNEWIGVFLTQVTDTRLVSNVADHNTGIGFALNNTRGSLVRPHRRQHPP